MWFLTSQKYDFEEKTTLQKLGVILILKVHSHLVLGTLVLCRLTPY